MLITDFDYDLPLELIAQYPEEKRDEARLLVVDRQKDAVYHRKFYDILDYLQPGDCLVMNDSRFFPPGSSAGSGIPAQRRSFCW